ncbi:DUF3173 domain-containing protein [Sporolactobacillus sp. KGMB 08714]|uniref:DUF3173 domain-containing protein n=1 Tax=Sporolactobacillus sp. KGMB 08714 TaxID=3064704 RepID=UPI002FBE2274
MNVTVSKDDLIELGFKKYQAVSLIRQAKAIMVHQHKCAYYNNKRLGIVPRFAVESILGFSMEMENKTDGE